MCFGAKSKRPSGSLVPTRTSGATAKTHVQSSGPVGTATNPVLSCSTAISVCSLASTQPRIVELADPESAETADWPGLQGGSARTHLIDFLAAAPREASRYSVVPCSLEPRKRRCALRRAPGRPSAHRSQYGGVQCL